MSEQRLPPVSRTHDPESSKIAERKLAPKRISLINLAYRAVKKWPDRTCDELCANMQAQYGEDAPKDRHALSKRLSDLKNIGHIEASKEPRKCKAVGTAQVTWRAT